MSINEKSAKDGQNSFSWKAIFRGYSCCGGDRDDLSVSSTDSKNPKTKHDLKKKGLKYKKLKNVPFAHDDNKSIASSTHWTDLEDIQLPSDPNIRLSSAYPNHVRQESVIDIEDYLTQEPIDFESLKKITQNEKELNEDISTKSVLTKKSKKIHKDYPTSYNKNHKTIDKNTDNPGSKVKRIPWQTYEDAQVIDYVAKYGPKWAKIASLLPGRTGKQVRDRYTNKLRPNINKDEWTQEEEELFTTLCQEMGHQWSKIASYLPGRTEGQVKNRYYAQFRRKNGKSDENDQTSVSPSAGLGSAEQIGDFTNTNGGNNGALNIKAQAPISYPSIFDSELESYIQTCITEGRDQVNQIKNSYTASHSHPANDIHMNDPTSVISYEGNMNNFQRMEQNINYVSDSRFNPIPYEHIDMNPVSLVSSLNTNQQHHSESQKLIPSRNNSYNGDRKSNVEDRKAPASNHCCVSANVLNECDKLSKRMDTLEYLLSNILKDMREIKFRENSSNPP